MVRQGFEPSKFNPTSSSNFAVGDDDDEPGNVGKMHEESEEAQHWHSRESEDAGEPSSKGETKFGSLDDRHVWTKDGDS